VVASEVGMMKKKQAVKNVLTGLILCVVIVAMGFVAVYSIQFVMAIPLQ
jgi:hypothetical protein